MFSIFKWINMLPQRAHICYSVVSLQCRDVGRVILKLILGYFQRKTSQFTILRVSHIPVLKLMWDKGGTCLGWGWVSHFHFPAYRSHFNKKTLRACSLQYPPVGDVCPVSQPVQYWISQYWFARCRYMGKAQRWGSVGCGLLTITDRWKCFQRPAWKNATFSKGRE